MPTNRRTGAAAVSRVGVSAGTIDSSSGSASVTPAPRRNVRRGMCFLAMNIESPSRSPKCRSAIVPPLDRRFHPHLELRAAHHAEHDRREPVVAPSPTSRAMARTVGMSVYSMPAADRVGHHLLDEHPHELRRIAQQRRPQSARAVDLLPVEQLHLRVDRHAAVAALLRAPAARRRRSSRARTRSGP